MPIYEYQCQKCKKTHEIWQKITEDPVKKCPDCKGKLERLIAPAGFILKGGGWYKDGYGSKKSSSDSSGGSSATADAAKDTKKDSKDSAPKSEAAEKAAEIKKKNDTAPRTDPKHKSNSPKAKKG